MTSPSQSIPLQHSPNIAQSYHPSINAAFSTPPSISEPLPPSSTLPDTSNSLRPYAYSSQQSYRSGGSASNPATPSYPSRHQSPQTYGYSSRNMDEGSTTGGRPMSIDGRAAPLMQSQPPPPAPKTGFRRVRGPGDLNPRVSAQPLNRRADSTGTSAFLSVRDSFYILQFLIVTNPHYALTLFDLLLECAAFEVPDDTACANIQHLQSSIPIRNGSQPSPSAHETEQASA